MDRMRESLNRPMMIVQHETETYNELNFVHLRYKIEQTKTMLSTEPREMSAWRQAEA